MHGTASGQGGWALAHATAYGLVHAGKGLCRAISATQHTATVGQVTQVTAHVGPTPALVQVRVTGVLGSTIANTYAVVSVLTNHGWVRVNVQPMGVWDNMSELDDKYDMDELDDMPSLLCWLVFVACGAYAQCAAMVNNVHASGLN